jgi:hypothetical protein
MDRRWLLSGMILTMQVTGSRRVGKETGASLRAYDQFLISGKLAATKESL